MKAVIYLGPGSVVVRDVPAPSLCDPRDAIVRVTRTGLCGTDLHPYRNALAGFDSGTVLGHEFAGIVDQVGPAAPFRRGERVFASDLVACGRCRECRAGGHYHCASVGLFGSSRLVGTPLDGGQAELVRVPFADVVLCRTPDGVSDEQALFVGDVLSTALAAIRAASVEPGQLVGVVGGGPVGLLAARCAGLAGAARTVVAEPDEGRRLLARRLGHIAVPPDQFVSALGRGADTVVEAVGSAAALAAAISAAAPRGTVVATGVHHEEAAAVPTGLAFARELTLRFVVGNPIVMREPALALLVAGKVDPTEVVSHRMPLGAAEKAYALFAAHEAVKVVLSVGEDAR